MEILNLENLDFVLFSKRRFLRLVHGEMFSQQTTTTSHEDRVQDLEAAPAETFTFPQPFTTQQLTERIAMFLGSGQHQQAQLYQQKYSEIVAQTTDLWSQYHDGQSASVKLDKEIDKLRTEIYSLQHQLCGKQLEQKAKVLESEHLLRHINDKLAQARNVEEHVKLANNQLSTCATGLYSDIASVNATSRLQQQQTGCVENREHGELVEQGPTTTSSVKRERERDDAGSNESERYQERRSTRKDGRNSQQMSSTCYHFNKQGGCYNSSYRCQRTHRCSKCRSKDHNALECDVEVYDRRCT